MRRKVIRVLLKNGEATININGSVKTSVDSNVEESKRFGVEMYLDSYGVWVSYKNKEGKPEEQLIPNGSFNSVLFNPSDRWEEARSAKKPQAVA